MKPRFISKRSLKVIALVLALFVTFSAGTVTGYLAKPVQAAEEPSEFAVFWEAWEIVTQHFVDREKIDFTRMTYGAIQGMLDSLGDQGHTAFFSPEVAAQENNALEGSYEGIGAYVDTEGETVRIVAPIWGSPAEAAGLLAGDIVLAIDGVEVTGLPSWEVIDKVRGPAGSQVTLTVLHPEAEDPVDVVVTRARIDVESVAWARVPETDLAYVQITQFAADTSTELRKALGEIRAEADAGRPIAGIILDLRNNPGGLLHQALRVASQFVPEGEIVLNERNAEGRVSSYKSQGRGLAREIPMVVLINEGSASAAEILSGALQAQGRAELVGMTTVGTGTVLVPFTLSDGSMIRLGVTNWLTPDMRLIKGQGIEPDVQVEQEPDVEKVDAYLLQDATDLQELPQADEQFNTALDRLQEELAQGS
jgi:carboxyl-terminal processing protease